LLQDLDQLKSADRVGLTEHKNPENIRTKADRLLWVNQLIADLPAVYRNLLSLYHLEEMSYKEIEAITAMPEGTIKSYLYRARQMLKERMLKQKVELEEWL